MKNIKIAAVLLGLIISMPSLAHVSLKQTVPAKDAMLMRSPTELSLTFSGKVRLIKLRMMTGDQSPFEFGFKPNIDPANTYQ